MVKPALFAALCAALILVHATCLAQGRADDGDAFARPHQLVSVGDHRLNLYCSGTGSPAVVFEAPSGTPGWTWWAVQPAVARTTRACVYDRAGLGFSDAATRPSTPANELDDLHALLATAEVQPPYVLVGNSVGGALVQLYTYRHPAEVAGLVLVEPMNEHDADRIDRVTQGKSSVMEAESRQGAKACADAVVQGAFIPGSDAMRGCVGGLDPAYHGALASVDLASRLAPSFWRAGRSEEDNLDAAQAQLAAVRASFGDLPVVVLVRGVSPYLVPGKPQSAMNKAVEAENLAMQQEVARLSTRGSWHVVPGAGHLIQQDRPEAVIRAVTDLLAHRP